MKKRLKISGTFSLTPGLISFSWLVYNFFALGAIKDRVANSEKLGLYVFIGFMVSFFFHLLALFTIFQRFQYFKQITVFGIIRLFIGVISFVSLIGDWAALSDIGKEYWHGYSNTIEWTFLYLAFIPHVFFHLLIIFMVFDIFRSLQKNQVEFVMKDEVIFTTVQYVGVLCGIIGLAFTCYTLVLHVGPGIMKYLVIPFSSFFILPYGLACCYWLILKRKNPLSEWYDEKQFQDISRAALVTLILSLPGLAVMFLLYYLLPNAAAGVLWFPYYLFLILVLFSASILYL